MDQTLVTEGVTRATDATKVASGATQRRYQIRSALWHAVVGLSIGLLVLHPLSMAVFGWLGMHSGDSSIPQATQLLWTSFTAPGLFPMGTVFGLSGLVVGALDGYHRSLAHFQRNELACQLALIEAYAAELKAQHERLQALELAKRRSTRFLVHDLKNHLGCVLGFAELTHRRAVVEQRERDCEELELILRQAQQMLGAVHDMLDLSRLEEAPGLDLALVDVPSILREVLDGAEAPGVTGRVRTGGTYLECPPILCDRRLVVRVFGNLVTNAIKHNPDGVVVTVDAAPADGVVVFSCRDDGRGIPAEFVPRLFDEFVADSKYSRGHTSGLGLAFCKAAVEAHGGKIWCESEPGRTTFQFTLPVRSVKRQGAPVTVRPVTGPPSSHMAHSEP